MPAAPLACLCLCRPYFPSAAAPLMEPTERSRKVDGGSTIGLCSGAAGLDGVWALPPLAPLGHHPPSRPHRHRPQCSEPPPMGLLHDDCSNLNFERKFYYSGFQDPLKNGILIVQTLRNSIMASTLLATTAITLSSLISVFVSSKSTSTASKLVYGNQTLTISSIKHFALLLCFLVAFLCNVQAIRYYAHVSFLATLPASKDRRDSIDYVARNLNRASFFWSLGLRAFYLSFPLFLWIFGPIPMSSCCCIMAFVLYFLDTTTSFTRQLHIDSMKEEPKTADV